MQEISNGDFQRINANAAAQRALTGGKKIIKRERRRHRFAHLRQKGVRKINGVLGHEHIPLAKKQARSLA
ncbi:hypothetical protein VEE56_18560 [Escherichia coli]|nr:hypothetical protein VEE56_18560 [Escherichia coli]